MTPRWRSTASSTSSEPEVEYVSLELPRRRRADRRAAGHALGLAAVPGARGAARPRRARVVDHERRLRQAGPRVPVRARDRGHVQLRRARARRRSGRRPVAATAALASSRTCARWRPRASGRRARATLTREGVPSFRALVEDAAELGIDRAPGRARERRRARRDDRRRAARAARVRRGVPRRLPARPAARRACQHRRVQHHSRRRRGLLRRGALAARDHPRRLRLELRRGDARPRTRSGTRSSSAASTAPAAGSSSGTTRSRTLRSRTGDSLPHCRTCYMVDTCAGGCMSRALAQSGTIHARDEHNCVVTRRINPELAADLAEGRLDPEPGWLPFSSTLTAAETGSARNGGAPGRARAALRAARLAGRPEATPVPPRAARRAGLVPTRDLARRFEARLWRLFR